MKPIITSCLLFLTGILLGQKAELVLPEGHLETVYEFNSFPGGLLVSADYQYGCEWELTTGKLIRKVSLEQLAEPCPYHLHRGESCPSTVNPRTFRTPDMDMQRVSSNEFRLDVQSGLDNPAGEELTPPPSVVLASGATLTQFDRPDDWRLNPSLENYPNTADQQYQLLRDQNVLRPLCPVDRMQLNLPFAVDGLTQSGTELFKLTDGQLKFYAYPSLEVSRTVTLKENGNLDEYDGGRVIGDYFCLGLAQEYAPVNIWKLNDGQKVYSSEALPQSAKILDYHPRSPYLLVNFKWIEGNSADDNPSLNGLATGYYLGRFNLDLLRIDQVYVSSSYVNDFFSRHAPRFSSDGQYVIITNDQSLVSYNTETGRRSYTFNGKLKSPSRISISGGNELLLAFAGNDRIYRWSWELPRKLSPTDSLDQKSIPTAEAVDVVNIDTREGLPTDFAAHQAFPGRSEGYLNIRQLNRRDVSPLVRRAPTFDIDEFYLYRVEEGQTRLFKLLNFPASVEASGGVATSVATYGTEKAALSRGDYLLLYDGQTGQLLAQTNKAFKKANELAFSRDGKLLWGLMDDGTLRLYDGQSLNKLGDIVFLEDGDWAVIGPNTLFDASPGGFGDLYFRATDQNNKDELIDLEQMKERFYDPGLLQKLTGVSEVPLRSVRGLSEAKLFPKVTLELSGNRLGVELEARNGGIGRVALFVNDKELTYDIRPNTTANTFSVDLDQPAYQKFYLRNNVISLQAFNEEESLHSRPISIDFLYPDGPDVRPRGSGGTATENRRRLSEAEAHAARLHLVCVGTSDYSGDEIDLAYCDQDANAMANALYLVGNELFGAYQEVTAYCLTTQKAAVAKSALSPKINWQYASRQNIEAVLTGLQSTVKPQDVVVVYLSGHGRTITIGEKEQFHYLTNDASSVSRVDPAQLANIAISTEELTTMLGKMPAYKQVVIIDACNSGRAIDDLTSGRNVNGSQRRALDRMSGRAGTYLLAGSAADMESFETSSYGQGLLTYALLEGMSGRSLRMDELEASNFYIGVTELFEYAQQRVPQLAKKVDRIQQPQINFPSKAGTFDLGIYNDRTPIKLSKAKPTVIAPQFQSEQNFADHLGLEAAVSRLLRLEIQNGKAAEFLFSEDSSFPNAYQLRGRYTQQADGTIHLKMYLLNPNQGAIEISVAAAKIATMPDDIVFELREALVKLKGE